MLNACRYRFTSVTFSICHHLAAGVIECGIRMIHLALVFSGMQLPIRVIGYAVTNVNRRRFARQNDRQDVGSFVV
jgi:hypothetical protein